MIQGGDPLGDGTGGPGYFVDEPPPPTTSYTEDVVAMAKSEVEPPGRSGSQFYVVIGTDLGLPPDYAVVGKLVEGDATMRAIENLGDPATETPSQPIVIEQATLIRRAEARGRRSSRESRRCSSTSTASSTSRTARFPAPKEAVGRAARGRARAAIRHQHHRPLALADAREARAARVSRSSRTSS